MPIRHSHYQLWIDLETTGLNRDIDVPLEVGLMVTDENFDMVDQREWLIYEPWFEEVPFSQMSDFVAKMHAENGLIEDCRFTGATISSIHQQMVEFVKDHGFGTGDPLCGSSVQFDRGFCERYFPAFIKQLSYRNIDVSTLKETVERFHSNGLVTLRDEKLMPKKAHRVIHDISDSVDEYEFYLKEFGIV